jgi:hypothetical protein
LFRDLKAPAPSYRAGKSNAATTTRATTKSTTNTVILRYAQDDGEKQTTAATTNNGRDKSKGKDKSKSKGKDKGKNKSNGKRCNGVSLRSRQRGCGGLVSGVVGWLRYWVRKVVLKHNGPPGGASGPIVFKSRLLSRDATGGGSSRPEALPDYYIIGLS